MVNDSYFENRNPNSLNTLGYDTFLIPIDNENNSVIQNNTSKVSLKLKSSGDRYSMFFSAFNVEVKDPVKEIESHLLTSKEIKEVQKPAAANPYLVVTEKENSNDSDSIKKENISPENPTVLEQAIAEIEPKNDVKEKTVEAKETQIEEEKVSPPSVERANQISLRFASLFLKATYTSPLSSISICPLQHSQTSAPADSILTSTSSRKVAPKSVERTIP